MLPAAAAALEPYQTGPAPGLSAAVDRAGDACSDFYQFACGGWLARNPLPADEARYGRFDELHERNLLTLRSILERAAPSAGRSELDRKIGDHYAACMDEAGIEAKGLHPLAPELARIDALADPAGLAEVVARLHRIGVPALFVIASEQDFKDSMTIIAKADQSGLGLPERDYYFRDDAKSAEVRQGYLAHVRRTFELAGQEREAAAAAAREVVDFETALARISLDVESRREPSRLYHKMTRAELQRLVPSISWSPYLGAVGAPPFESLNVASPGFFRGLEGALRAARLGTLKAYLRWQLIRESAPLLPAAFVVERFAFYGRALTGAREMRPRWKRCVELADEHLGDALGRRYVEETFGADGKARMEAMVDALEKALARDVRELAWMTPATKAQALAKLTAVARKIGYPGRWRDYADLEIARDDALGNAQRARSFEVRRTLAKIGRPVDRDEWEMSPPTVNAYYNPLMNDINFPAGILQPPFFDRALDDAVNYGSIGAVIGHELSHGFDDQGRKFDAKGNLRDWWTEADGKEFEARASCIVDQYSKY
ncbi:MAG TPA: M13 family metallopeptidase, partial [Vicinamibacteria bacterium]|nr:M13 family metallopeptidase [Vicinamibacteria bacterium]